MKKARRVRGKLNRLHVAAKRRAGNQRGFTLVEMLIVIALIALAAVIMYGVLGNSYADASVKQAATKIGDDMRSVNDASQKYFVDKGSESTALSGAGTALVDAGYMTMVPVPPSAVTSGYTWDSSTYTATWGTAAADTVVKATLAATAATTCQKINELFAGDAAGAAIPAAVRAGKDLQCFGAGPYTVVKTMYVH